MISITRRVAVTLKSVFRVALNLSTRGPHPLVLIEASEAGYRIRCRTAEATAEFRTTDEPLNERLTVPFVLLADCGTNNDQPLALEQTTDGIFARWLDAAVPQVRRFDSIDLPGEAWPKLPELFAENSAQLFSALSDACQVTDPNSARYALGCVQLTGDGRVVATDGRQALVLSGYHFPWEGEILVPASKLFGYKHLPPSEGVQIGKNDDWLTLHIGNWTFQFKVQEGRFPRVDDMLQPTESAVASVEIAPKDREFLRENLWLLPGDKDFNSPCTFDLNGKVAVRAKASDADAITELVLNGSTRTGEAIRFSSNRRYIERAIQLGFDRIHLSSASSPAYCSDEKRHYLWALLEPKDALKPTPNAVQIESPAAQPNSHNRISHHLTRQKMTTSRKSNQHASACDTASSTSADRPLPVETTPAVEERAHGETSAIDQAVALRDSLRGITGEVGELVRALKREKRQHRAVRSTLLSLRQLQAIDA